MRKTFLNRYQYQDEPAGNVPKVFVTFEGPEGAGKSTLIGVIAERLASVGRAALQTREPGSTDFGAALRRLLLEGDDLLPESELFLFLADRADHVRRVIRPALDEGKIVLCDRYADSTLVYQGYGRGLDLDFLRRANAFATGGLGPHITLLLDLDQEIGLARLSAKDRLDREPFDFHRRVREGFLEEARREPDRWVVLDASQSPEQVAARAWDAIRARLNAGDAE